MGQYGGSARRVVKSLSSLPPPRLVSPLAARPHLRKTLLSQNTLSQNTQPLANKSSSRKQLLLSQTTPLSNNSSPLPSPLTTSQRPDTSNKKKTITPEDEALLTALPLPAALTSPLLSPPHHHRTPHQETTTTPEDKTEVRPVHCRQVQVMAHAVGRK